MRIPLPQRSLPDLVCCIMRHTGTLMPTEIPNVPCSPQTHRTLQDLALHREFDVNCKRKSDQPTFPAKQRVRRPQTEPIIPAVNTIDAGI